MSKSVLLLGASGRTGRLVLRLALDGGHRVTALVRSEKRLADAPDSRLTKVVGEACDPATLRQLVPGHDVVVSTLGPRWPTRAAAAVYPDSAAAFVPAMEEAGVRRLLVTSSALLFEQRTCTAWLLRRAVPSVVHGAASMEAVVRRSDLDFTLVRTSFLDDSDDPAHRLGADALPDAPGSVSRLAVARYLLSQIEAEEGHRRRVVGLCR